MSETPLSEIPNHILADRVWSGMNWHYPHLEKFKERVAELEKSLQLQEIWNTWKESCDTLVGPDEKYARLKRECLKRGWIPPQEGSEDNWSMQKFVTQQCREAVNSLKIEGL